MSKSKSLTRRTFIKNSAGAAVALSMPALIPKDAFGANDRIRVAVLGVNGRGKSHIKGFQSLDNVEVACLCDPDSLSSGRACLRRSNAPTRWVPRQHCANTQGDRDLRRGPLASGASALRGDFGPAITQRRRDYEQRNEEYSRHGSCSLWLHLARAHTLLTLAPRRRRRTRSEPALGPWFRLSLLRASQPSESTRVGEPTSGFPSPRTAANDLPLEFSSGPARCGPNTLLRIHILVRTFRQEGSR